MRSPSSDIGHWSLATGHSPARSSRRSFLQRAALGTAALALASRFTASARAASATSTDKSTDPLYMSTVKLAELIRTKKLTSAEVVHLHIKRIEAVNGKLNAVVAKCFERAISEAKAADASLAKGKLLGPLHGVPFTVKDSFDTAGVLSTGGTLGRKDFVPGTDATVVARCRAAGAILLGKSNTPEFTLGGGGKGTVNLVFGVTRNPYNLNYQPSGSSGGAGAIVAAGGASFDLGSDYGGSIRGPAFANGIAGIKPTYGRVSRWGHIVGYGGPFDSFQETGPLARRVEDIQLLMEIIGGPDGHDAAMALVPLGDPAKVDLKKLRVCYYTTNKLADPTPEIQASVKQTVAYFAELGCKITEDLPPKWKEQADIRRAFNGADGREHIRRLLKKHGTTQASPGLNVSGDVLTAADITRLSEELDATRSEQLAWFEKYDLIIAPASSSAPITLDAERPANWMYANYTSTYNTNGWPAGNVRTGTAEKDGVPIGIQVIAQPWRDDVVLAALSYIESKTGGFQKPAI